MHEPGLNRAASIHHIIDVHSFIDWLAEKQALGPVLLGVSAAAAWVFNKYYSYVYWRHTKDIETIEILTAIRTEITENVLSFEANFSRSSHFRVLRNLRDMARSGRRFPLVTAEAGENAVYNSIKSRLTVLPTNLIEPVVKYYNQESFLSASYHALSNPILTKRKITITIDRIRLTFRAAEDAIKVGKSTVVTIDGDVLALKAQIRNRIAYNALGFVMVLVLVLSALTW